MSFMGWYDPDRKRPTRTKLAEAVQRYEDKFGKKATCCLTSPIDAAEIADDPKADPGVEVYARGYIARWTFYIGEGCEER